jgi:hypothetical protein
MMVTLSGNAYLRDSRQLRRRRQDFPHGKRGAVRADAGFMGQRTENNATQSAAGGIER